MTSERKNIIYILPHYDDEMFVIPKITNDVRNGSNVKFFFLMYSELRLKESLKFLQILGVHTENIFSIGNSKNLITDGSIHKYIEPAYKEILSLLKNENIDEIVTTAYEGGHNDHDAASLISRFVSLKFKSKLMEFYLYNGHKTYGKIYRVASPVNVKSLVCYNYIFSDIKALIYAPFIYISQLSTMIGLWPFLFIKVLFLKPLFLNVLDLEQLTLVDHGDSPLYERWDRISHEEFKMHKIKFIDKISKIQKP